MGLSAREQFRYWGLATAIFVGFLWLMGNTLLPFIVGAAIAYLLDPWADWLETKGVSRAMATSLITAFVVLIFVLFLLFFVPFVGQQITQLVDAAPDMADRLQAWLSERFPGAFEDGSSFRQTLSKMTTAFQEGSLSILQSVLASSLAVLDFLLLLIVSPVVAFYLLLDWDRMIARIDDLLPREHLATIRGLASQVDGVLSGFVRGQLTVCMILGTFYALSLGVIGLQFGVIVGMFAGLISFIPFVGSIVGGTLSVGLALFQFWGEWWWIAGIAAVFAVGQAVEGNVLTPNLVGSSVGLHPVWLIFALSAFGALFGFAGLLVAVPVAAVIGVLSRFVIEQYRGGRLFKGSERDAAE